MGQDKFPSNPVRTHSRQNQFWIKSFKGLVIHNNFTYIMHCYYFLMDLSSFKGKENSLGDPLKSF